MAGLRVCVPAHVNYTAWQTVLCFTGTVPGPWIILTTAPHTPAGGMKMKERSREELEVRLRLTYLFHRGAFSPLVYTGPPGPGQMKSLKENLS